MIRLVTFADKSMTQSMDKCCDSAVKHGVDVCWPQNPDCIDQVFKDFNAEILSAPRGFGLWLWKPYFIYKAILKCEDGDILIWSDAGQEFVNNVRYVVDQMKDDIFLFNNGFSHVEWCKWNVIETILGSSWEKNGKYSNAHWWRQCQASLQFYRVNKKTKDFVKEWLMYCQMQGLIDDSPSKIENYPTFADHRHDQAILTCVAIKYGIPLHWFPSTTNHHRYDTKLPGDDYPEIVLHHRKRNRGFGQGINPEW